MTLPLPNNCPAKPPKSALSLAGKAAVVGCAALLLFAAGLWSKPFADEYAYISQSYYADLLFEGRVHEFLWLDFPAYDLQPLPKYLIGLSLHRAGIKPPSRGNAFDWYDHYAKFGDVRTLAAARRPVVVLAALGCVAIFGCGVLIRDIRAGLFAALLLMLNPLYRLHAHRAMSDVPSEAFGLAGLALGLWAYSRIWRGRFGAGVVVAAVLAGIAVGGSLLCKFNGFLPLFIMGGWSLASCIAPRLAVRRKLAIVAALLVTTGIALSVAVALNPYLTAQPRAGLEFLPASSQALVHQSALQRFRFQVDHRVDLSSVQKKNYPNDALYTLPQKSLVTLVQGYGRFGPFGPFESDSTARFSLRQDWGLVVWLPVVLLAFVHTGRLARAQLAAGEPPTAAALLIWAALAWVVVAVYLPMAWDRYLLPIQSGNALLAAVAGSSLCGRLRSRKSAARGPGT